MWHEYKISQWWADLTFLASPWLLGNINLRINTSGMFLCRDSPLGCGGWCNAWRLCHGVSLHIPRPTPEVSICFTVVCSISALREASRRGDCGRGRLLARLVHFTVDVILLRDTVTLGRGRWLWMVAVFRWQGGCKHWGARRWVYTGVCGTDRARFSLLLRGLSKCVCVGTVNYNSWQGSWWGLRRWLVGCAYLSFGVLEHSVPVICCSPFTSQLAVWLKIVPSPCMLPTRWCLIVPTYVSPCHGVSPVAAIKGMV